MTKNYQVKSGNLINDLTDHLPNYMTVTRSKSIQLKERPLCIYFWKNTQNFIRGMKLADMSDIYRPTSNEVNEAFNKFNLIITKCFEENFPLARLSRKRQKDKKMYYSISQEKCIS